MAGKSLIILKGISQALVEALATQKIYDQTDLLLQVRAADSRSTLANKLSEHVGHDILVRNVNSWLRQADLLRIQDMMPDLAYLLSLIGIRCIADLAKADPVRMLPLLKSLASVHPDFELAPEERPLEVFLSEMVAAAFAIDAAGDFNKLDVYGQPEPAHLFAPRAASSAHVRSDADIIQEGLSSLKETPLTLPLPRFVSGVVKMRSFDESDADALVQRGLEVAITGITSPDVDDSKSDACCSTTTDGNGRFILSLPDNYCLHASVGIKISQGSNSQTFTFTYEQLADNIFLNCPDGSRIKALDLMDLYQRISDLNDRIQQQEEELRVYLLATQYKAQSVHQPDVCAFSDQQLETIDRYLAKVPDLTQLKLDIASGKEERTAMLRRIYNVDARSNDLKFTLDEVINDNALQSELPDIILTREIFTSQTHLYSRALPSVKLMGEGEQAVYLSTDTAPSRVFGYKMLQRLVEPVLSSGARTAVHEPVDVMYFRMAMQKKAKDFPMMGSLGIGYSLNMHQAWCPDGFALGDLLYSLILAPGEEQRVVVKEKSQTYAITDVAEGTDSNRNTSTQLQTDDTQAAFDSALSKLSEASGKVESESSGWSIGATLGYSNWGVGAAANGGYSSTSSSSNSSSRQSNSMDEASAASQQFQHAIQTAAQKISQAKRMSIRTASSEESDSVASKIVANHNHMHAMTVQYWEVMRRYRLETCIDSVDLVLFVPFQPIQFLSECEDLYYKFSDSFTTKDFKDRYASFVRYYDALRPALPYKYVQGLDLIQKYNAYPDWKIQSASSLETVTISVTITGKFFKFDNVQATLYLKNGHGSVQGVLSKIEGNDVDIPSSTTATTRAEVIAEFREKRGSKSDASLTFQFVLPEGTNAMDLSSVSFRRAPKPTAYTYPIKQMQWGPSVDTAIDNYEDELRKLYQDNTDSSGDRRRMRHYATIIPDCYFHPTVTLSSSELLDTGDVEISNVQVSDNIQTTLPETEMRRNYGFSANLSSMLPVLHYSDLQKIEAMAQHVASETVHYSKVVWAALSASERAMLLEPYTIDLQFSSDQTEKADLEKVLNISDTNIPLLNCIDVNNVIGFYGNSMLFPFTYPDALAQKIGRSAKELQDSLYRYHASNFRVTTTVISLPTQGMVGEAVLGETNVAEEIDLTRFWKWDDSPIDQMSISKDYFKTDKSYLNGKNTQEISALNLGSAELAKAIQSNEDLLSAVKSRSLANLFPELASTGLSQANTAIENGTTAQKEMLENALNDSKKLASKALSVSEAVRIDDHATQQAIEALSDPTKAADKAGGAGGSGSAGKPGAGSGTDGIGSINIYINGNQVKTDSATTKPAASTDGSKPAASTDGSKPAAPTDGSKPAAK